MRSLKTEKHLAKREAREQAMIGWTRGMKGGDRQKVADSRNAQRGISLGIGHHFARMMKGHI